MSQHEYINAFGSYSWRRTIASSFSPPDPGSSPEPRPKPQPLPATAAGFVKALESTLAKE